MSDRLRVRSLAAVSAAVLACLVLAPSRPAAAGESPTKRYRDPNAKFSFRIFDDFDPIPVETEGKGMNLLATDGKYVVVQYHQTGAEKRNVYPAKLRAYRIGMGSAGLRSGGETTGEGGSQEDEFLKKLRSAMGEDDPKTMKEVLDLVLKREYSTFLDPKAAKKIKSKDGIEGQLWVLEKKSAYVSPDEKPFYLVFAAWKKEQMELGLFMECGGDQKKKFEQGFIQVAKSFKFFDPQAEDVKSLDVLNGLPISARRRRTIERGIVKGWDVHVSPNKNYIIIYNTKGRRNNLLAKIIADRIEAIRSQVYEKLFPPSEKIEAISIVRICGDEGEYHAYGGPWGSAGYWSDDTEELVFYDASPKKEPDDDTVSVLYHEAFHQYIYYSVGEVAPHSWFNEGTGDYFAGARYSGGKFSIKPFRWRTETIRNAIRKGPVPVEVTTNSEGETKLKFDWSVEGYIPLPAFVRMTQGEYYGPLIGQCYAQGWAFNYFLREVVPKNAKWNEKWGKILTTYFDTLKTEVNKEKPLVPKKEKPEEPGMDDPEGDEPEPDEPGMDEPGMDDPGMGEPGMDEPGMGEGDGEDPEAFMPRAFSRYTSPEKALRKAVDEAFKGVDMDELEKAWKESTLKVK
jgi:hypothetical protein